MIEARTHCRKYAQLVAELYLYLREGQPLTLLARKDQDEEGDMRFYLSADGSYRVEQAQKAS
jgi:hypothetical protein